ISFAELLGRAPERALLGCADVIACGLPGAIWLFVLPTVVATPLFVVALWAMGVAEASEPALLAASGDAGATRMLLYGAVFNFGSAFGAGAGGLMLALGGFTLLG